MLTLTLITLLTLLTLTHGNPTNPNLTHHEVLVLTQPFL